MFKIAVLITAVLATVASQPMLRQQGSQTQLRPSIGLVRVGHLIQRVPTAVSHQSQTVVHDHANIIRDIVTPAVISRIIPINTQDTSAPSTQTNGNQKATENPSQIYNLSQADMDRILCPICY